MVYILHDVLQSVKLGLLEIVRPVHGVEPDIQKVLGPLAIPDDEATRRQAILILSEDEVYPVPLQIAECLDDAVWRDNGCIGDHKRLEFGGGEEGGVNRDRGIHNQSGLVEVPEEFGAWVEGYGVAHGWDTSPCRWCIAKRILVGLREEGEVAYQRHC
jgi:hypothetical protein